MNITLKYLAIQNFKGIRELNINFSDGVTTISGRNATGKSTCLDAFFWLLFDKDASGSSNFQIRPTDADGKDIDNIEIQVVGGFDVNGEELELCKTQKQKWVKKRGSDAPTYEGNVNEYQINGFPSNKREYTNKVASLVDENVFSLLTNPRTFAALPWKQQREMILRLVSDVTDEDVLANGDEDYSLIEKDVLQAGADKAKEKYQKALKQLKDEQKSYPIRIDEASKSLVDEIPADELEMHKAAINEELDAIKAQRNDLTSALEAVKQVQSDLMNARLELANIEQTANQGLREKRFELRQKLQAAETEKRDLELKNTDIKRSMEGADRANAYNEKRIAELAEQYKAVKRSTVPESDTVCPTCGRPFEDGELEKIKAGFDEGKKKRLDEISVEGKKLRASIDQNKEVAKAAKAQLDELQEKYVAVQEHITEITEKLNALPNGIDPTQTDEYKSAQERVEKLEKQLAGMNTEEERQNLLDEREAAVRERQTYLNRAYMAVEQNERTRERIAELKDAQMDCSQMVADEERKLYLAENYIKAKMDMLSDRINSKFKAVRFRLFTEQINGGMTPTCVMQINSNGSYVDYANANNAAQILGGLDVIEALSELYGVKVPVWLDNAEAIDGSNTPEVSTQMILLRVTDDEKLIVS